MEALEKEKAENEKRIQDLLDEKQRIHCQWADERRSLDHRVRLLEQDLRRLMGGSPSGGLPTHYNDGFYGAPRSVDSPPPSQRAALMPTEATVQRVDELIVRQKIADRNALNNRNNRKPL